MERTTTWSNIGTKVEDCRTLDDVLTKANLNYEVETRPIYFNDSLGNNILVPKQMATVRTNDNYTYGVVSNKYNVVQNRDAFDFVNYINNEIEFVKAGETYTGMVYIIAKMQDMNILGDAFTPYVIFRNSFAGNTRISAAISPLRIVCQNQFNFVFKNTDNTVNIKHTSNANVKLTEAQEVLKQTADYMQDLNNMAEKFARIKLSEFEVQKFLRLAFPMDNVEELSTQKRNKLEQARLDFKNAYLTDDNYNFRGTAWGLINAYTDLITHQKVKGKEGTKYETNFTRITFDKPMNNIIQLIKEAKTA